MNNIDVENDLKKSQHELFFSISEVKLNISKRNKQKMKADRFCFWSEANAERKTKQAYALKNICFKCL